MPPESLRKCMEETTAGVMGTRLQCFNAGHATAHDGDDALAKATWRTRMANGFANCATQDAFMDANLRGDCGHQALSNHQCFRPASAQSWGKHHAPHLPPRNPGPP